MGKRNIAGKSYSLLKETYLNFQSDRVLKLSASLAYYTIFTLPALFLIIISLTGIFLGAEASQGIVFDQLNSLIGNKAAEQIQTTIANTHFSGKTYIGTIVGGVTLLLSAISIFGEMQDSLNMIWGLKAKPKRGFIKYLLNRLISFSLVVTFGFIMLVSLIISGLMMALQTHLEALFPEVGVILLFVVDYALQLVVTTFLFALIFKVLPDAKIKWGDVIKGAVFTSVLFLIGKFAITYAIDRNPITQAYGAAGSVLILLLWVYYSTVILYTGAEFIQSYTRHYGSGINPNKYAVMEDADMARSDV